MKNKVTRKKTKKMAAPKPRSKIIVILLLHGLAGGLLGCLVLHPFSMFINLSESSAVSLVQVLKMSFSLKHLLMATYFTALGGIFSVIYGLYAYRLSLANAKLQHLSVTDDLTGLFNRRYLMQQLNSEIDKALKTDHVFSLVMIDIDYFKQYNDRNGHLMGDAFLASFASLITQNLRKTDLPARFGGGEFAIIASGENGTVAVKFAERLRKKVEDYSFPQEEKQPSGKITISVGVVEFASDMKTLDNLVRSADKSLYQAKLKGRNRVCHLKVSSKIKS